MKRNVFFATISALLVLALSSCTGNEQLLKDMVGTWDGTTNVNYGDGTKAEAQQILQFFASEDGKTGKFIEVLNGSEADTDEDGIEYEVPYTTFIIGNYLVDEDGDLQLRYDLNTLSVFAHQDGIEDYAQKNYDYYNSGEVENMFDGATVADIAEFFQDNFQKHFMETWSSNYESENEAGDNSFYFGLKVEDGVLSYDTGDMGTVKFKKIADLFDELPEETEYAAEDAATKL